MALSNEDRRRVIGALERAENAIVEAALASFEAFVLWLLHELKDVYWRIVDSLRSLYGIVWGIFRFQT